MTSKTDQGGKVTQYGYDQLGRLTSVTQDPVTPANPAGLNLVTKYGYDELGSRVSQTDANNHKTSYDYDQLGRRVKRTLPLGQSETHSYNQSGTLKTRTDFDGRTTTYAYDDLNRLLSKTADPYFAQHGLGAAVVSFTYTADGKRQTMTDASGTTTYVYDPVSGRLTSKQTPEGTLSYTYNNTGNVLSITSSNTNGAAMAYTYDELNRLSTVTVPGQSPTTYSYDEVGNLGGYTYPNGVATSYTYDKLNRLTDMSVKKAGTALSSYTYTLGAAGNRKKVVELSGRTVEYGYDNLYRLTSETISGDLAGKNGVVGYTYDAVGNRKERTSTLEAVPASGLLYYDANDRTSTDSYDDNGNTVSQAGIDNAYDFENRLVRHGAMTFTYDGDGNRVAKTVGDVTTQFLVDTVNPTGYVQVVDELTNGTVSRTYAYGLDLISQSQTIDSVLKTTWYGYDGHGSVRVLIDDAGSVTDTYAYDAFGNTINQTGSTPNNRLYAGEQYDWNLGLYYNRARYLDVRSGRFWGMDTFEGSPYDPTSLHKYLYACANPVNGTDPSGNFTLPEMMISVAISLTLLAITACNRPRDPVIVGVEFDNDWIYGKPPLNQYEIDLLKQTTMATLREAYQGYGVIFNKGPSGTRHIWIQGGLQGKPGETTLGTRASHVYIEDLYATLIHLSDACWSIDDCMGKSRIEMIQALGRGVGATAAHELGHQGGFYFTKDILEPDKYDTNSAAGSVVHFFGKKTWSDGAKRIMDNVLPVSPK